MIPPVGQVFGGGRVAAAAGFGQLGEMFGRVEEVEDPHGAGEVRDHEVVQPGAVVGQRHPLFGPVHADLGGNGARAAGPSPRAPSGRPDTASTCCSGVDARRDMGTSLLLVDRKNRTNASTSHVVPNLPPTFETLTPSDHNRKTAVELRLRSRSPESKILNSKSRNKNDGTDLVLELIECRWTRVSRKRAGCPAPGTS